MFHAGRRRSARDVALAIDAAVCLTGARLALALVPFRWIVDVSIRPPRRVAAERDRDRAIRDVRWAIAAAAARLPGETVCFPRALAAQSMLRRRGVATTMTYGARTRDARLDAHVWLTAGSTGIVGHEAASDFSALATYAGASHGRSVQEV
jgi:hypothetical protein